MSTSGRWRVPGPTPARILVRARAAGAAAVVLVLAVGCSAGGRSPDVPTAAPDAADGAPVATPTAPVRAGDATTTQPPTTRPTSSPATSATPAPDSASPPGPGGATTSEPAATSPTNPDAGPTPPPGPTAGATPRAAARTAAIVASMSDEQLAGQLLVLTVHGADAHDVGAQHAAANRRLYGVGTPAEVVERLQPGGVILMGRAAGAAGRGSDNVADPRQVPDLVGGLQAAGTLPLLVAIDQEHGPVARLGPPFTRFPAAMALGAVGDATLARRVAAAAAAELAVAGITVNLAPVADVNTEPTNPVIGLRSPGEDPARSSELVAAQVTGIQRDAGIAATAKHFPGHGDTTLDSHDALPTVDATRSQLRAEALRPFRAAVDAGVELVMPGHLLLPAVDPEHPATLSPAVLRGLLRDELGFEGVIISDSMLMGAVRRGDGAATAVDAVAAGVDLVLMPPDPLATRAAIVAALADGRLQREQVEASVRRVLALKQRLGLLDGTATPRLPDQRLLAGHRELAVAAAARAVTVLDGQCPPPLATGTPVRVVGDDAGTVSALLEDAGVVVADDAATSVVLWDGRGEAPVVDGAVVVVTGSPYAAGRVVGHRSLLLTYGDTATARRGLVAALVDGVFTATSPVTIPRRDGEALPLGSGVRCP